MKTFPKSMFIRFQSNLEELSSYEKKNTLNTEDFIIGK